MLSQTDANAGNTRETNPRVLLVSGWQTINIGDVAHTPGTVRALAELGDCEVVLWPRKIDERERAMLQRRFPNMSILTNAADLGADIPTELSDAFAWADVCVHASGPSIVGAKQIDLWREHTGKPYGFFGVTVDPLTPYADVLERSGRIIRAIDGDLLAPQDRARLAEASFVWCRDSLTVDFLATQGLTDGVAFGPDATVICDVRDDEAADRFLREMQVHPGEFICVVPRLRYTPYHQFRDDGRSHQEIVRDAINVGFLDEDMQLLRELVLTWLRNTDDDIVIVPEMSYAVEMAAQNLSDWPEDVADRVKLLPRFWDLSEAASVYRQANAVLSMECHSPLIALAVGTPALYLRQSTDTVKGQMYEDLGTPDRIHEIATADPAVVADALLRLRSEEERARTQERADHALSLVADRAQSAISLTRSVNV